MFDLRTLLGEGTWVEVTSDGQTVQVLFYQRALDEVERANLTAYFQRIVDNPSIAFLSPVEEDARRRILGLITDPAPHHNID